MRTGRGVAGGSATDKLHTISAVLPRSITVVSLEVLDNC